MPVDMLLSRYFEELEKVIPWSDRPFRREGRADLDMLRMPLPPYRQVFHGLCLVEHSRGYRLPEYGEFRRVYINALRKHHRYEQARGELFDGAGGVHLGLLHRISGWYLDGLRHTHLYCALVQAFEEQRRIGVVLMDARADVKLKADILVVTPSRVARVSIEAGTGRSQEQLMAHRAAAEQEAKRYNQTSSERDNPLLDAVFTARIAGSEVDQSTSLGVPLFGAEAIDSIIRQLDDCFGVPGHLSISYTQMKDLKMWDLKRLNDAGRIPRFSTTSF